MILSWLINSIIIMIGEELVATPSHARREFETEGCKSRRNSPQSSPHPRENLRSVVLQLEHAATPGNDCDPLDMGKLPKSINHMYGNHVPS